MSFHRFLIPAAAICSAILGVAAEDTGKAFSLGGNFNESLHHAEVFRLDAGETEWIRGFLPATEFVGGPRRLESDRRLQTFHQARESGRKIALTLKWDFKNTGTRVPAPGSKEEAAYFQWTLDVIEHGKPDLLLLINEIFIDTMKADMVPGPDGEIAMVRFLKRLTSHVRASAPTTPDGRSPLPLSCGGFTRMETEDKRNAPATKALLPWLASTQQIDFVNFHMHGDDLEDFSDALEFMDSRVPGKPFVITEFSLIWRYKQNLEDPLGSTPEGKAFAGEYHHDPKTTTLEYLNACSRKQVPEKEFNAFLRSRTWYVPDFLDQAVELMRAHRVRHAFYAYHQGAPDRRHRLGPDSTPWSLNPVFIDRFAVSPDPDRPAANLDFAKTYLRESRATR